MNHEPATSAKVSLETTKGTLEIELWTNEAPAAARAFLVHLSGGDFDDAVVSRVTSDLVQVRPSNPVIAGETIAVETNSRLRFTRRGIVAYIPSGSRSDNEESGNFFITLKPLPQLNGKYTIIGRLVGESVYVLERMASAELQNEVPINPIKVKGAGIVVPPPFELPKRPKPASTVPVAPTPARAPPKRQLRIYDDSFGPKGKQPKRKPADRSDSAPSQDPTLAKLIAFEKRFHELERKRESELAK